jgi:hypothetical protein
MFEVSRNIYFVVYNLYYVGQNDDLGIRARPINRDGGSMILLHDIVHYKGSIIYMISQYDTMHCDLSESNQE